MTAILLPWLKFAVCVALIGLAGPALTRNGDIIARLTGLSRSWIGLVLLATATSLPELFTGVSAVTVADAPNIAVGDALGSCVFNLMMLVLLDKPMYRRIDQGHILTAGFGVIMIGAAGAFLLLSQNALRFQFLHVSGYTPLIAGATSAPELVVTVSALRLRAVDMAIGNLLGSKLFGVLILAIDDIVYSKGPLLRAVSSAHAVTAFAAAIMSGIFIVAMRLGLP